MKIKITRNRLMETLRKVQNVSATKTAMPILQNVKLEAADGKLTATCTDLDVVVSAVSVCEIEEVGATTIPVKMLSSAVSKLPEGMIDIVTDNFERATIKAGNARFIISGRPVSDFPKNQEIADGKNYKCAAKDFKNMLMKTQYASATDDTRRALTGVYMSFTNGNVVLVATDGRRLAKTEKTVNIGSGDFNMIIPQKTVAVLLRELDVDGEVEIINGNNMSVFAMEGLSIWSKMIDAQYPNYTQVIPTSFTKEIKVDKSLLCDAVSRTMVLSPLNPVVKMLFEEGRLIVTCVSADIGEAKDEVPVKYNGESFSIMFNPDYVLAPLKVFDNDEVTLSFNDGMAPGMFSDAESICVLMPLRV